MKKFGENYGDLTEMIFHQSKSNPNKDVINAFLKITAETSPVHSCFGRLIEVGEELKNCFKGEHKAPVLVNLGNLYSDLRRFDDSEKAYKEALKIRKELAEKNPDAYLPDVATTQNNIGVLCSDLGRIDDSEKAYKEALNGREVEFHPQNEIDLMVAILVKHILSLGQSKT